MKAKELHKLSPIGSHPAADVYPLIEGDDASAFCRSVKEPSGPGSTPKVSNPIVILTKGTNLTVNGEATTHLTDDVIVDGRNRTIAALDSGILWEDIPKRNYNPEVDGDLVEFVDRENYNRRQLTPAQKSLKGAEIARRIKARLEAEADRAPRAPLGDSEPPTERASHKARKEAAKQVGVSEDSVKKAQQIEKHPDLVAAVKSGKVKLPVAAKQAGVRDEAALSAKRADQRKNERKDALLLLKGVHGEDSQFTKAVARQSVFKDDKGHKDLLLFNELDKATQKAIIPLLITKVSLKDCVALHASSPTEDSTIGDLVNYAIVQGVGIKSDSKTLDFSGFFVTITASKDKAEALKSLTGAK